MKNKTKYFQIILILPLFFFLSCKERSILESRQIEIQKIKKILINNWSNKNVQFEKEEKYFDKLFSSFTEDVLLDEKKFFELLDRKLRSLHDAHLRFSVPNNIKIIQSHINSSFISLLYLK